MDKTILKAKLDNPSLSGLPDKDVQAFVVNRKAFRTGITQEEIKETYRQWVKDGHYDQDLNLNRYRGPLIAAQTVKQYIPSDQRDSVLVLDVAAGTGNVSKYLGDFGFTMVDALDPSEEMLSMAKSRNLCRRYICDKISDKNTQINDDTYDVLATVGAMGEGHIYCSGLREMIRITKPGGLIVIIMKEEALYKTPEYADRLEPLMKRLEESGVWTRKERSIVPKYSWNFDGIVYVYQVNHSGNPPPCLFQEPYN